MSKKKLKIFIMESEEFFNFVIEKIERIMSIIAEMNERLWDRARSIKAG